MRSSIAFIVILSLLAICNVHGDGDGCDSQGISVSGSLDTLTITSNYAAHYVFKISTGATIDISIDGINGVPVVTNTSTGSTVAITFVGASSDISAAHSTASSSTWSRAAMVGAAMAAAHYMGGNGLFGAVAGVMIPTPVHAACINTITIRVPESSYTHFDLSGSGQLDTQCPSNQVSFPNAGCVQWQSAYTRVWSSPSNAASCATIVPADITATSIKDDSLSVSTSQLPQVSRYDSSSGSFRINYTLPGNGEDAVIRIWANFEYGHGLVPVEVYSSSLSCVFAYSCTSGNCTATVGTNLCAAYTYVAPPPQADCNVTLATCPRSATYCTTQCSSRDPTTANCSSELCTAAQCAYPSISTRCRCDGISAASHSSMPIVMIISTMIAAIVFFIDFST